MLSIFNEIHFFFLWNLIPILLLLQQKLNFLLLEQTLVPPAAILFWNGMMKLIHKALQSQSTILYYLSILFSPLIFSPELNSASLCNNHYASALPYLFFLLSLLVDYEMHIRKWRNLTSLLHCFLFNTPLLLR